MHCTFICDDDAGARRVEYKQRVCGMAGGRVWIATCSTAGAGRPILVRRRWWLPIALRFGLRSGAGVSDCGVYYRPAGTTAGDGRRILFCICGNRRRAVVVG